MSRFNRRLHHQTVRANRRPAPKREAAKRLVSSPPRPHQERRRDLTAARRRAIALFTIDTAITSGFALRAPGGGSLDILAPTGLPSEIREPIVDALGRYRPEVVAILEYLDDQRGEGQTWAPPRRGTLQ
jgi:hypothetical protein